MQSQKVLDTFMRELYNKDKCCGMFEINGIKVYSMMTASIHLRKERVYRDLLTSFPCIFRKKQLIIERLTFSQVHFYVFFYCQILLFSCELYYDDATLPKACAFLRVSQILAERVLDSYNFLCWKTLQNRWGQTEIALFNLGVVQFFVTQHVLILNSFLKSSVARELLLGQMKTDGRQGTWLPPHPPHPPI